MKNIKKRHIQTCLVFTGAEFDKIIKTCFGDDVVVAYVWGKMVIKHENEEPIDIETIRLTLAQYFGVDKVFSIHSELDFYPTDDNDCDNGSVWLKIREKRK